MTSPKNSEQNPAMPTVSGELATISAAASHEDALWLKDKLESAGLLAVIEQLDLDDDDQDEGAAEVISDAAFQVKVMASQSIAAMEFVQSLLEDEDGPSDGRNEDVADDWDDEEWAQDSWDDDNDDTFSKEQTIPNFIAMPIIVVFTLFCILLAIGYLLFIGFPTGLFE